MKPPASRGGMRANTNLRARPGLKQNNQYQPSNIFTPTHSKNNQQAVNTYIDSDINAKKKDGVDLKNHLKHGRA